MQRPMILQCRVSVNNETPSMYHVSTNLFDGTEVSFNTSVHNVQLSQPISPENPTVLGWVEVVQESKQNGRAAITLPSPSIHFGRNISVNESQLMPLGVTIENFKMKEFPR